VIDEVLNANKLFNLITEINQLKDQMESSIEKLKDLSTIENFPNALKTIREMMRIIQRIERKMTTLAENIP